MADVAVANPGAVAGDGEQPAAPQQGMFGVIKGMAIRMLMIYLVTSFFRGKPAENPNTDGLPAGRPGPTYPPSHNLFPNGTVMDLYVYVSENQNKPNYTSDLVWKKERLMYGDWYSGPNEDSSYEYETKIIPSPILLNNGSVYLHVYLVKEGLTPFPGNREAKVMKVHTVKQLNRFKKRKYKVLHNLLTGETDASKETQEKVKANVNEEIISHWHPNLTINLVDDHTMWTKGAVPQPLDEYITFEPTSGKYYPILYLNDYWNLARDYRVINETDKELPLYLTFKPLSMIRWQMYTAQAMRNKWGSMLGGEMMQESDEEQDSIKEAFLETSPYLLALTMIVSLTHSVFEFLAFKNDIQFWKDRRSMEGLSVRSVFFNVVQSVIVLLYVLDNDTNTLIRISVFVGLIIEIWKIFKVQNVKFNFENKILGLIPRVSIEDKSDYVKSSTKEYDNQAFKYLSWACFPLLAGYAVYSLLYLEHKGLYSWVLSLLYGFLLTFGFIMMTPQLFINYKLKSVAHLPWRMLTYKFLNTFIDDIFAFIIKMPTLYRLGCFRDDIIFLIYLYQRWIYRVDLSRVNEFGISGEEMAAAAAGITLPPVGDEAASTSEGSGDLKAIEAPEKTKTDKKQD